jgi:hypothetical protein
MYCEKIEKLKQKEQLNRFYIKNKTYKESDAAWMPLLYIIFKYKSFYFI